MPPRPRATRSEGLGDDARAILDTMEEKFDQMKAEIANLNTTLAGKCTQIAELSDEVSILKKKVSKLENALDDEDAYVRRETIIFNGSALPPAHPGEICNNVIRKVIKDKFKIELQVSDISVAHRAGKKPNTQAPDRRGMQVRFCRRDIKRQIMTSKCDNSDLNNTLYTNESLTPKRRTILFALRQIKKKFPDIVKGCTSQDGRVYAFTPSPASVAASADDTVLRAAGSSGLRASTPRGRDRKHLVNTHDALVEFCAEFVQHPLEEFLDSWEY